MLYEIKGPSNLKGSIKINGNKNGVLPCLAATLLTNEPITLHNVPQLEDVKVTLQILEHLGVHVTQHDDNTHSYTIQASTIRTHQIPDTLAKKIRASILFLGPLLARIGEVDLYPPGGDIIGRRRLDTHIHSLTALGTTFAINDTIYGNVSSLIGTEIFQDEASVTATENTIMAAVLATGTTVIENAACEPHIKDLCNMLIDMGGNITGIGSNILTITGVEKLHGTEFSIGPDFMEVGSMIGLAAATRSEIEIHGVCRADLRMTEIAFGKLGISWEYDKNNMFIPKQQEFQVQHDLGEAIPTIADAPWPGFPPDLTSIILVVATQVSGTILIHEKMFESRMFFTDKLALMGARIILCDPHRAVVSGPSKLVGTTLSSPDVRAGMAMVIAALAATGKSTIHNIYEIERGYENLAERLNNLGAQIKKID